MSTTRSRNEQYESTLHRTIERLQDQLYDARSVNRALAEENRKMHDQIKALTEALITLGATL